VAISQCRSYCYSSLGSFAYPWLVSIGIHKALSPISIQLVATQGFDPIIRVVALCSNMSQAAASLAVGLKSKNKELKSLAFHQVLLHILVVLLNQHYLVLTYD
jgi:phosphotransferase system  glucose/maltose/N-acetylglucosamine-specific IIC component